MDKKTFLKMKEKLFKLTDEVVISETASDKDKEAVVRLSNILKDYYYENRLRIKGRLTRAIIDSLELDYEIGDRFIDFDNFIE